MCEFIYLSIYLFIYLFIYLCIYLLFIIYLFICLFVYLFVYLFIYLFLNYSRDLATVFERKSPCMICFIKFKNANLKISHS